MQGENDGQAGSPMRSEQEREPVIWQKVEWRQGDGRYVFEVQQGGLHATLSSPHGQRMTIPMVAWQGLVDALAASRKAKERSERQQPPRSFVRWSSAELDEMLAAYHAGATIRSLAQAHNRSEQAIESQLSKDGLWDRVLREPIGNGQKNSSGENRKPEDRTPAPWPPDYWDSPVASICTAAPVHGAVVQGGTNAKTASGPAAPPGK